MNRDPLQMFKAFPPVVKNLIIINVLFFLAKSFLPPPYGGGGMVNLLALFSPNTGNFQWHQILSHMFMHGGPVHLFMNMYVLSMFGPMAEANYGSKKFIFFYISCGLGSAALAVFMAYLANAPYVMLGASGAVAGTVLLFAYYNPNRLLRIILLPFSFKAWNLVTWAMLIELVLGLNNHFRFIEAIPPTGIAHFGHLGGMVMAYILIKLWELQASSNR